MRKQFILAAAASGFIAACGEAPDSQQDIAIDGNEATAADTEGEVELIGATRSSIGSVNYRQEGSGVMLQVSVQGLTPGTHAVHIHQVGDCASPDFSSAGGHWNPTGAQHGRDNPQGAHLGDLANMEIGEDGSGSANYMVTGASISGADPAMADADGTALVIHEGADDYKSDPAGDAGSRVACAVLAGPA